MKNVNQAWCINIEITSKCERRCSNCHHLIPYRDDQDMSIETFENSCKSLSGWNGFVGIIGGNPVLHEKFDQITKILSSYFPFKQRAIFFSDWYDKEPFIRDNYSYINYNPHAELCKHQSVLVSSKDCIQDDTRRAELIDKCWIADKWSPLITSKGVYRCEVAACLDLAIDYNLGLPIEKDWYNRAIQDFQKQIDTFCNLCGVCIPFAERIDCEMKDDISKSTMELLKPDKIKRDYILHNVSDYNYEKMREKIKEPEKYIQRMKT